MRIDVKLDSVPYRAALRYLGWRGTAVDARVEQQLTRAAELILREVTPAVEIRRFALSEERTLMGTAFSPQGEDIAALLRPCHEAALMAATLGAQSERLLLREQALDPAQALVLDAELTACIESVCDMAQAQLENALREEGLYLTERFSPGYGDMPLAQTWEICRVLSSDRTIGLTLSSSGIMIPRKSVTAVIGISRNPQAKRKSKCARCSMRRTCAMGRYKQGEKEAFGMTGSPAGGRTCHGGYNDEDE